MKTPWLLLTGALLLGCGDVPTAPPNDSYPARPSLSTEDDDDLVYWSNAPGAPSLASTSVSFYAVKGKDRQVSLWYHAPAGQDDSTEFIRLRVRAGSLLARPDGTPFLPGDSILITATVVDTARLIVEFQPSGLRFDPKRPARLWFKWAETNPDFNHDGVVDEADQEYLLASRVWRQEAVGEPWEDIDSDISEPNETFEARIEGFTRYVVAY